MNIARLSRFFRGATSVALISAVATLGGCGFDQDCVDCGPCGIFGGPNVGDGISTPDPGVDPAGVPTVELLLQKDGECGGINGRTYWMRFSMGAVSLEERPEPQGLDTSAVTYDGRYRWTDKDLLMTFERPGRDVRFEFQEGMKTTFVLCGIESGAITCSVSSPEDA